MRFRGRAVTIGLVAAAGVALAAALGGQAERNGARPQLQPLLDEMVAAGAPGALALLKDDSGTSRAARGVASREEGAPLRPGDRFRIGSVTKTFVAVVVLQLVSEGKLRLEDTVESWLPGVVPDGRAITVRNLLGHTSGLFDHVEDRAVFAPYNGNTGFAWSPRGLVELAVSHQPVFTPPGARFSYSSTNYLLLGLIVEAATGMNIEQQLRRRIFLPLGLRQTSFAPLRVRGRYAHGHEAASHGGVVTGIPVDTSDTAASWSWAAGAIVSNADDLARFYAALLDGRLLRPEQLREMEVLVKAGRNRYGLGLAVYPTPCGPAWGHTGNIQGTVAVVWNTKGAARQLVLMVNTSPLSGDLEAALRRAQVAAFCGSAQEP